MDELIYTFEMRRRQHLGTAAREHCTITVAVPRPQGWRTPTRAMLVATKRAAFCHPDVVDLEALGWNVSRVTHPQCECDTPTVGASGCCGFCGGSNTPALPWR